MTHSRSSFTKTPTSAINDDRRLTISRAALGSMNRGLRGQKLNPIASAPASLAASASSSVRTPQILTLIRLTARLLNQLLQGDAGIGGAHKGLADQKGAVTGSLQPANVVTLRDAALADENGSGRRKLRE